jgi:uncharacterized protein YciI
MLRTQRRKLAIVLSLGLMAAGAGAQTETPPASPAEVALFAVEIKVGSKWDSAKPPQEQAFFREHSANLRRMREAGVLVMGARYSDKGLVIVSAASIAEVNAQMEQDPSFAAGTFIYEVHPFNVFYAGELQTPRR